MDSYKKEYTLEKRIEECRLIVAKYPERVPVIIERGNEKIKRISKKKFLVPVGLKVSEFVYIIRKRLELKPEEALFIFIENALPSYNEEMGNIYNKFKDTDGFLYVLYSKESTFGDF